MANHLNQNLILNKYYLSLLGLDTVEELQQSFSGVAEWYDERWESYIATKMRSNEWKLAQQKLTPTQIAHYDKNIKKHIDHIAQHRWFDFKLKYFQYLAVFFVEHYLTQLFADQHQFITDLNTFVEEYNQDKKDKEMTPACP